MKICQICMDGRIGMYMDGRVSHHLYTYSTLISTYLNVQYAKPYTYNTSVTVEEWPNQSNKDPKTIL